VNFDLKKLAGIEGGSFLISTSYRFGSSLSAEYIGNAFTVQQVFAGETFRLVSLSYRQKLLADRLEFRLGRIASGDDFLVSPYNYVFVQNGFDGNPAGIFFNSPGMTGDGRGLRGLLVGEGVAADLDEIRGVLCSDLVERRVALAAIVVIHVQPVRAVVGGGVQLRLGRTGAVRGTSRQQDSGKASEHKGLGSHGIGFS